MTADKITEQDVVTFWGSGVGKSFRAFLYVAASSLISFGIAAGTKHSPTFAAEITPLVNLLLVQAKILLLGSDTPNLPTSITGLRKKR